MPNSPSKSDQGVAVDPVRQDAYLKGLAAGRSERAADVARWERRFDAWQSWRAFEIEENGLRADADRLAAGLKARGVTPGLNPDGACDDAEKALSWIDDLRAENERLRESLRWAVNWIDFTHEIPVGEDEESDMERWKAAYKLAGASDEILAPDPKEA
jgi:hypothetical protein